MNCDRAAENAYYVNTSGQYYLAMDEEEAELRNPFPSPPSHYTNYTSHNLDLLALLRERISDTDTDLSTENQREILANQTDVPNWPLTQLEKPRVDWIVEDGYYNVFGDKWFVRVTFVRCLQRG
jgi:mediator of RNA polymerase II transcription subunit 7